MGRSRFRRRSLAAVALAGLVAAGMAAATTESAGICDPDPGVNGAALLEAVAESNANATQDTLLLTEGCTYAIGETLVVEPDTSSPSGGDEAVPNPLTIVGSGATVAAAGDGAMRVVEVAPDAVLVLDGVTVTGGEAPADDGGGGGILVSSLGRLTLEDSVLAGNASPDRGAALAVYGVADLYASTITGNHSGPGGSIVENAVDLSLEDTTVARNAGEGGATIRNAGAMDLLNSTVAENTGQARAIESTSALDVRDSTVVRNDGAGIVNRVVGSVVNSIVADNGGESCGGAAMEGGRVLSSDPTCPGGAAGKDLGLGALGDHGGPTATVALLGGSPAVDPDECAPGSAAADQRGVTRDTACDVGAFEFSDSDGDGLDDAAARVAQGTAGGGEAGCLAPPAGDDEYDYRAEACASGEGEEAEGDPGEEAPEGTGDDEDDYDYAAGGGAAAVEEDGTGDPYDYRDDGAADGDEAAGGDAASSSEDPYDYRDDGAQGVEEAEWPGGDHAEAGDPYDYRDDDAAGDDADEDEDGDEDEPVAD